jgi:hypothetical protein
MKGRLIAVAGGIFLRVPKNALVSREQMDCRYPILC